MNKNNADYWISQLGLSPHPEGGYYRSTFASNDDTVNENGNRKLYTSIYFLLQSNEVSHFHRLKSDELWYFHGGSSLSVHIINDQGEYFEKKLGLDLENNEEPQVLVPKNSIFGSSVSGENTFSLVGCMVSPGFDFQDFELLLKDDLLQKYPQYADIIHQLAYEKLL
jgi:uncharacterized protein